MTGQVSRWAAGLPNGFESSKSRLTFHLYGRTGLQEHRQPEQKELESNGSPGQVPQNAGDSASLAAGFCDCKAPNLFDVPLVRALES